MSDDRTGGTARGRATVVAALAVVLGATSLHAVLSTQQWFWPMVLAVAVVAAVGALARRSGLPVALHPLAALAALLVVLTALYAHDQAWAGFVPTTSSLGRLGTLAGDGATDLKTLLAPTYPSTQLKLLAVGGVGIIALAVDLLAVSGRRPTLAGAPLILLVAVPSAIRERSVGYASLFAAAAGFLLLLTLDSEDRTSRWGRVLPNAKDGGIGPSATGTAGPALRIGVTALLVAVAVPLAIPGADISRFAAAGGDGNSGSGGRSVIIDPLSSIATELTEQSTKPLLVVKSGQPTYQRITALEDFNDAGFSLGAVTAPTSAKVKHGLAPLPISVPHTTITQQLTASDTLVQSLLPVPIGTTDVDIHGDWRLYPPTRTIFSASTNTRGSSWTATADLPAPSAALLRAGGLLHRTESEFPTPLGVDLQVPSDLPPLVLATAESWTAGAVTAYDAAVAIQQHFTSGDFHYDTTVAFVNGPRGFTQFLAEKRGFCEQYATTMAAMMRLLGVPARVAIGFTAGTPDKAGNTWTITGADAHAWPEVWFDDAGWVRFEPTPLSDGRALTPRYTGSGIRGSGGPSTQPTSVPTVGVPGASASQPAKLDRQPGDRPGGGAAGNRSTGGGIAGPVWAGVGVLVLAMLLLVPLLVDRATRRRRLARGADAELVWGQLLDDAADRLVPVQPSDSPRMAGRRLRAVLQAGAGANEPVVAALGRLVAAVEEARYAAPEHRSAARDDLSDDERTVCAALSKGLPAARRLIAVAVPPSARARLVAPPTRLGLALLDGLDRLARLVSRRRAASV